MSVNACLNFFRFRLGDIFHHVFSQNPVNYEGMLVSLSKSFVQLD